MRHFLLFSDIKKYILWYQGISLNSWYRKMIFCYQKIDFLISEYDFLLTENWSFGILKCVIFFISIMWISDKKIICFNIQNITYFLTQQMRFSDIKNSDFLMSKNDFLISRIRIWYLKNDFLISNIKIIDIRKSFSKKNSIIFITKNWFSDIKNFKFFISQILDIRKWFF